MGMYGPAGHIPRYASSPPPLPEWIIIIGKLMVLPVLAGALFFVDIVGLMFLHFVFGLDIPLDENNHQNNYCWFIIWILPILIFYFFWLPPKHHNTPASSFVVPCHTCGKELNIRSDNFRIEWDRYDGQRHCVACATSLCIQTQIKMPSSGTEEAVNSSEVPGNMGGKKHNIIRDDFRKEWDNYESHRHCCA